MAVMNKKRPVMTLYSGTEDIESHRVRIVLAEKGIIANVIEIGPHALQEDLSALNPYNTTPTLVDRELILYDASVIMEYLDERFPHPPLLPVYPVARAKFRLMMYRINRDLYSLVLKIERNTIDADRARQMLCENLIAIAPIFNDFPYFLSDDFSLVDACLAPILWRLPLLGVELPNSPATLPLLKYIERVFARDSFQTSLTESEREQRLAS